MPERPISPLERARTLLGPGRQRKPTVRLRGVHLRAGLGEAVDHLARQVMRRVFITAHRRSVSGHGGNVRGLGMQWARHAGEAAQDPDQFFPRPAAPTPERDSRGALSGGRIEDLRFASYYSAREATLELLRKYPENATTRVRHFRHDERARRPAIICLHGWAGGRFSVEARVFAAHWLYHLGLDVYLYTHPYHGPRNPAGAIGAMLHPSTHVTRCNEAFLQTAWEVRSVVAYHQAHSDGGKAGIVGMSLGGYATAVVASVAPELAFAVPVMPIGDLPAFLWSWGEGTEDRRRAEASGVNFDELWQAMAVHAPFAHRLAIPKERVLIVAGHGDGIVPPAHAIALAEHWERPALHWFPGGHLLHFGRTEYLEQLRRFLGSCGVV